MQFTPVGRERHAGKRWRGMTNLAFTAASAVVPLVGAEFAQAAVSMPIGFTQQSDKHFLAGAILSLTPGRNLFVAPDGRWLGSYIPAMFRSYPFRLLRKENTSDWLLCIDEQSDLIVEGASDGQPFFDAEGNLAPATKGVFEFLGQVERNRFATNAAVSALAEAGVIRPWEIKLKAGDKEQTITGLYCVDEAAMNALSDEAFLRLRKASALPIAYAQLLSMGQLKVFEQLAKLQSQLAQAQVAKPATTLPDSLDKIFGLPSDDTVRFT